MDRVDQDQPEELWLREGDYEVGPESSHRLRKAPVAAAIAAAVALAGVMAMPRSWVEQAVYELYIDSIIPAAKLPLGDMAHAVVAFVVAALVAAIVFLIARFVDFGSLFARNKPANPFDEFDDVDAGPRLSRADRHPDAPSRAPFRVAAAIEGDAESNEGIAASYVDDGLSQSVSYDDEADADAFDLEGFEEAVNEAVAVEEIQDIPPPVVFDVGDIDVPEPEAVEGDGVEEGARPVSYNDDSLVDVRERFAVIFGPGEQPGMRDGGGDMHEDLARLDTSHLIDELERRLVERRAALAADDNIPAENEAVVSDDNGTDSDEDVEIDVVVEGDGVDTEPVGAVPAEEPVPEQAEVVEMVDEAVAEDVSDTDSDPVANDDEEATDFEEMDAALKAALSTLARMQQRSAG